MRTPRRLIALVAAGALLVGCGSTTAGTAQLGAVASQPPAASDQVDPQETTEEPADTTTDEPADTTTDETEQAPADDPTVEAPDAGDLPTGLPGNLDACMTVGLAYLSIFSATFATQASELDQILVDIDTALAAAPEEIRPALQTLADLSRGLQGTSIDEWSTVMSSPEFTAASDEVSAWMDATCNG